MKKFKLIKQYPGSPKLGTTVTKTCGWYTEGPGSTTYDQHLIENDPEYWQETKQGNYQIISFFYNGWDGKIATLNEKGNYSTSYEKLGWTLHEMLNVGISVKTGRIKIHSVKRLSDGEVFAVGDLVKTPYTDCTRIVEFKNPEAEEFFIGIPTGFTRLLSLEKVKNPIFLTHNGKDIFEGDKVHWVKKDSLAYDSFCVMPGMKFFSDLNAYFLTREEAEDYIQKNKVQFITEDGVEISKNQVVYVLDGRLNSVDMIINFVPKDYPTCKAFSTAKAAEDYIVQHKYALSIEDFWEFVSWGGSNFSKSKRLRRLVKERLSLK